MTRPVRHLLLTGTEPQATNARSSYRLRTLLVARPVPTCTFLWRTHIFTMHDVIEVTIKGLMPTANGCAVFLGNDVKTFVIYVDPSVGSAISMTISGVKKERPLTHDLIGHIFLGFGIGLERIVINDVNDGTYFARVILQMKNELGLKILELDARPSDSIVLALQQKRPIFVARAVFDIVEDMSEILERVLKQQKEESKDEGDQ